MSEQVWTAFVTAFPWAALITALSTIAAVFVTSHLTERRSRRERLWDLQREAFGEIISSVREGERLMLRLTALAEAAKANPSLGGSLTQLNKEWQENGAAGRRRAARDGLVLPDDFNDVYQQMAKKMSELDALDRPQIELGRQAVAIMQSSREELERIARAHLKRRV